MDESELNTMIESDHWWPVVESNPMKRTTTESYHVADLKGKAEPPSLERKPKKKREPLKIIKISNDEIPESAKYVGTCRELCHRKFPVDYWQQQPGCWMRVHNRPRKAMFTPTGIKNGPPLNLLDESRVANVKFLCWKW